MSASALGFGLWSCAGRLEAPWGSSGGTAPPGLAESEEGSVGTSLSKAAGGLRSPRPGGRIRNRVNKHAPSRRAGRRMGVLEACSGARLVRQDGHLSEGYRLNLWQCCWRERTQSARRTGQLGPRAGR